VNKSQKHGTSVALRALRINKYGPREIKKKLEALDRKTLHDYGNFFLKKTKRKKENMDASINAPNSLP